MDHYFHPLSARMLKSDFLSSHLIHPLTSRGKKPKSVIVDRRYFWEHSMSASEDQFEPTVSEPWVAHVFGRLDVPESLAVTVDGQMQLIGIGVEGGGP